MNGAWVWMLGSAGLIAAYMLLGSSYPPHDENLWFAILYVAVICGPMTWLAFRVRRERNVGGAFWFLAIYTTMTLGASAIALSGGLADDAPPAHVAVLGAVAAVVLVITVFKLRSARQ